MSTLIDYKGFRCLAIAKIPIINQVDPSFGFSKVIYNQREAKLRKIFQNLGNILKLKSN